MKNNFYKKIVTLLILLSFIAPKSAFAIPVTVTSAPVGDVQQILDTLKEYGLDTLASSLVQIISTKISNKVFNKANGGASGDSSQPSFIESFSSYFGNLQSGQIDKYLTDLGISSNPFAAEITKSLVTSAQSLSQGKGPLESFNLDKVIGANWKDFETNANVGGWDGFLALSNPANTNIGASLIAREDIASAIETAKDLEQIKLGGAGTKPQGKCNLTFAQYKQTAESFKNNNVSTTAPTVPTVPTAGLGNTSIPQGPTSNGNGTNVLGGITGIAEDYGGCISELINNPVGLVTDTIGSALDSAQEKLSQGDELGELIAGMLMQMANTFIKAGLSSLKADFESNKNGVGGPEQLVAKNGASIPWTKTPSNVIDLPVEFPPAVEATQAEVTAMTNYIERLTFAGDNSTSFATTISNLDTCIPGPDYGYKKRLAAYTSKQTKKLDKRKSKGNSKKRNFKNIVFDDITISVDDAKVSMSLAILNAERNIPGGSAMLAQVQSIGTIQQKYYETKSELTKKQITLNLLYSIESGLKSSIQTLGTYVANLPPTVPFSNYSWSRLNPSTTSTTLSTEQKTILTWAKNLSIKIPPGVAITPDKLPLTLGDWDTLTAAQKTAAVSWATSRMADGDIRDTTTTDKDFVLGTVWYMYGIDSEKTDFEIKRDYALSIIWKVWVNPEQYMTTPWDTESADAKTFLAAKNKIRTSYAALQNDISVPYTLQKSETALKQLDELIKRANELLADCKTMEQIVRANQYTGADANVRYQTLLINNISRFKSDDVKQAIKNKDGILSLIDATQYPEGVKVYDQAFIDALGGFSGRHLLGKPFNELDLAVPVEIAEDDYEPSDDGNRRIMNSIDAYLYQVPPARTLYELFEQGNSAFCTLNQFLTLSRVDFPNPALDGKKPILCDGDKWNTIEKNDIRAIIFGSNDEE